MSSGDWRETTGKPVNMSIFRQEFDDFLPEKILDFHVHVFEEGVLPGKEPYSCAGHPIRRFDAKDLMQTMADLYPGRETSAVCFGMPHPKYDMHLNNRYVEENCNTDTLFPFRLFDPNENPESTVEEIRKGSFLGLKPYLNYVAKTDPNDVEIVEMLPRWVMECVDELGLIVMLHIPRKQRLADPKNREQIIKLCTDYPDARIVLAHVGRAYYLRNIVGHLDDFGELENLWYDLAMLNHWEVLEYLFENVPSDRILYGTDLPIAAAPGKSVEINDQYTYVTPVPWHLSISDDHGKLHFTSFAYEELRAIKKAVHWRGMDKDFVEKLFYRNGMDLLSECKARRKG